MLQWLRRRDLLLVIAVLGVGLWLMQSGSLAGVHGLGLGDYIAYWSAGRVAYEGGNPYSPAELIPLQQELGWPDVWPNIMYYPPWTVPLLEPFGILPFWTSRFLWLIIHLVIVVWSADRAWLFFGGAREDRWLAWLLSLVFLPTLIVLRIGQIGPLLLLGMVSFLHCQERRWDFAAGASLVLVAIKPHLMYLPGALIVLWAIQQRRWKILAGAATAASCLVLLAMLKNPNIISHYRSSMVHLPTNNMTPTLGTLVRLAMGRDQIFFQFVPTVVGLAFCGFIGWRLRNDWRWSEQISVLLLVSFVTASYGAWIFDVVILLIPVIQAAVWVRRSKNPRIIGVGCAAFALIDGTILCMNLRGATYPSFIWVVPALLLAFLALRRARGEQVARAIRLTPGCEGPTT